MVDAVIKIGGSLAEDQIILRKLCDQLNVLAEAYDLIIVPGGGVFADIVRSVYHQFKLSEESAHRMAILAMDQYGMLLAFLMANSKTTYALSNAKQILKKGKIPIFLPSRLFFSKGLLEASWNVTSDSIAAYTCKLLKVKKLILIKNVDGIFTEDPKKNPNAKLIKEISAAQLSEMKTTSVDNYLSKIIKTSNFKCYVLNGKHPNRIIDALESKPTLSTIIHG
jgi:aspartokinase-like uncharacterized kinase